MIITFSPAALRTPVVCVVWINRRKETRSGGASLFLSNTEPAPSPLCIPHRGRAHGGKGMSTHEFFALILIIVITGTASAAFLSWLVSVYAQRERVYQGRRGVDYSRID